MCTDSVFKPYHFWFFHFERKWFLTGFFLVGAFCWHFRSGFTVIFSYESTIVLHTACSLSTHFCVPFSFGLATAENIHVIVLHTASNGAKPISVILPIPMDTHSRLLHMTRGFKVVVPFAWKRKCTLLIDATVIFRLEAAVSNPAILEACMRPERFAIIKRFLFHLEVFWFSELFCFCSKAIKFVATTLLVQYS